MALAMANCMLNLASSPVCGRLLRSTLVLRRLVETVTALMSAGPTFLSASMSSTPSMARWVQ